MLQRALSLSLEEADPVAASEASAAADEAARAARAVAAVEELQRIEGDVATLTANVALFSECLAAAGEEPAEVLANEVLVDMLPSLRESQPRVLRLIEGGEVEDEGLVERLFALHEQLSYCVGKYDELAGAAAPPPPAAAAPAAAPAPAPAAAIFDLDLLSDPDAGNAAFVPVAAAPSLAAATAGAIAEPAALARRGSPLHGRHGTPRGRGAADHPRRRGRRAVRRGARPAADRAAAATAGGERGRRRQCACDRAGGAASVVRIAGAPRRPLKP